jgi:hypothetical protein
MNFKIIFWIIIIMASLSLLVTCHYNEEVIKKQNKIYILEQKS